MALTTHVLSELDLKVTINPPILSPWILDQPIGHAILHTIADSQNSMVHILQRFKLQARQPSYYGGEELVHQ